MAVGATGTPTALGIPKYATGSDAPSGQGFNSAMDAIDALIAGRMTAPTSPSVGDVPVWNGSAWVKSATTKIALGGLEQGGAATNNVLTWNGSAWAPAAPAAPGPQVYDRVTSIVDVTSTAAATDVYSKSIAGGDLGTNKMLRLTLLGDFLYNVSSVALTLKVMFGATTVGSVTMGTSTVISATRQPLAVRVELHNAGVTNNQRVMTIIDNGFRSAHGTMNDGTGGWAIHDSNSIHNTGGIMYDVGASEDTTTAKTLAVNVQWGSASASLSFRILYGLLELI